MRVEEICGNLSCKNKWLSTRLYHISTGHKTERYWIYHYPWFTLYATAFQICPSHRMVNNLHETSSSSSVFMQHYNHLQFPIFREEAAICLSSKCKGLWGFCAWRPFPKESVLKTYKCSVFILHKEQLWVT